MRRFKRPIGSPPPMRGKVAAVQKRVNQLRITPAYAGKSDNDFTFKQTGEDHPRLCGEKTRQRISSFSMMGSPPPMRGKVRTVSTLTVRQRITPAYAGKSLNFVLLYSLTRDHPRLCGEKAKYGITEDTLKGSPPPMRGKVLRKIL